ncbi:MAG: transposase [Candidatus Poribacteria bacterium]|nr:transposase [Candidatus Poribacteria bacterium]
MWSLGIDWAEKHLDFCLLSESGNVIQRGRVDNKEDGWAQMLSDVLKSASDNEHLMAAIESPHQLVVEYLMARKTEAQWEAFLNEKHVYHPKARERFFSAMKQKPMPIDNDVISAKSLLAQTLVSQLSSLIEALNLYQERIEAILCDFDDFDRFKSLPGVFLILGAKLLVAIGTCRLRFATAAELQSLFGTAPYTKSSGQNRSVHFRRACHKSMRTALHQMALASMRTSAWAKAYFAKKRKEGKSGAHALRCLANLWLKVIFAIWKNETQYKESEHLAAVARHQLSQPI